MSAHGKTLALGLAGALALLAALPLGCSASTGAKPEKVCTPNKEVFCRCRDRAEGTKICNEDGSAYGKCEPCETDDNPELLEEDPLDDGGRPPLPSRDAGADGGSTKPACGDKIVQQGEQCDDGNTAAADGCNACKIDGEAASAKVCPGMPVHLWDATPIVITGAIGGSTNNFSASPSCNGVAGTTTQDRVYAVTPHKAGTLRIATSGANFNNLLYVADACDATTYPAPIKHTACANASSGNGAETLTVPATDGKTVFVFVDGAGGTGFGNYTLTLTLQ